MKYEVVEREGDIYDVVVNGKVEFTWCDSQGYECPEDMIWSRDIGAIFERAFELGYRLRDNEIQTNKRRIIKAMENDPPRGTNLR